MADPNAPLSIESAMGLLIEKNSAAPSEGNSPSAQAKAPAEGAAAEDKTPPAEAESADAPASNEGEQNTPADDQGDDHDEGEDQGDALPPIEAPSSWKAEEKEVWKSLPRAAQEAIARREQDRTTELRNLQNQSAEQRKSAETEVTRLKGLTDQIAKHLETDLAALAKDFPEIRSEADVVALAQSDPAKYATFQARLMQFQSKQQAAAAAHQELQQKTEKENNDRIVAAKDGLLKAFPKWKDDPQVARKEIIELQDYAISQGADEKAARTTLDPIVYKLAHKAMLYDRAQAKKAEAVQKNPPRVVTPGNENGRKPDAKAESRRLKLTKLDQSHDLEDARGLLRI